MPTRADDVLFFSPPECVSCLHAPMMYGDRFYAFLCSLCNAPTDAGRGAVGNEFMLRLHMRWVDFIHLATFHLGMLLGKTYIDIHDDLVEGFLDAPGPEHGLLLAGDDVDRHPDEQRGREVEDLVEDGAERRQPVATPVRVGVFEEPSKHEREKVGGRW